MTTTHGQLSRAELDIVREQLTSAVISDCLDAIGLRHQCLATGIRPLEPDQVIAGFAFPVAIERVDRCSRAAISGPRRGARRDRRGRGVS